MLRTNEPTAYATRAASTKAKAKRVAAAIPSEDQLTKRLGPVWRKNIGERVAKAAKLTGEDISQEQLRKLVADAVKDEARILKVQLAGVTERTRKRVEKIVSNGLAKGQRADTIAERLQGTLGAGRAKAVAETETHRASQGATQYVYEVLGVPSKRWITQRDNRVRDTHRRMDTQTRLIDQPFKSPSGHTAEFPGGFGVPEEDVGCRCVAVPVKTKRRSLEWTDASAAAEWRAQDTDLKRFDAEALRIVADEFRKALEAVQRVARSL